MKIHEVKTVGDYLEYKQEIAVERRLDRLATTDPAHLFGPALDYWLDVNGRGNWLAEYGRLSFTILDVTTDGDRLYTVDVFTNGHDVATHTGSHYDVLIWLENNSERLARLYTATAPGDDVATVHDGHGSTARRLDREDGLQ